MTEPSPPAGADWIGDRLSLILIGVFPVAVLLNNRAAVLPMLAIALIGAWRVVRTRDLTLPLSRPVVVALILALAWGGASTLWAFDRTLVPPRVAELLGLAVAGTLALRAIGGIAPRRLLGAAMIGLAVGCAVALADIVTGYHLMGAVHRSNSASSLSSRFSGHFKAGTTVVVLWSGIAVWAGVGRRWWLRSAGLFGLVIGLAGLANSFASMLALALGCGAGLATLVLPRLAPAAIGLIAVATVLAAPLAVSMPPTKDLSERFPHIPNSTLHRTMIWHFAATKVMERPLLGWGLDASRVIPGGEETEMVYTRVLPDEPATPQPAQRMPLHPHDFALQMWLETGAVGAVLVAGLIAALAAGGAGWRRGAARAGAMTTLAAALGVAAVGYGAWQAWWVASLWLTAALVAGILGGKQTAD
jgi:O-antigen ligase